MPQIDIKDIELFHRDDYPDNQTRLPSGVVETISLIIEPDFSERENKATDFFTFKPRRFEFSIRKEDYTFFNVDESPLTAHQNFPNLSDYLIRVFNNSDELIFEGILSVETAFKENTQIISLMAYDPIVLIGDSALEYDINELQNSYTDPHDLAAFLFGTAAGNVLGLYFLNSSYYPSYDDSWVEYDFDLGAYQLLHDWGTNITTFYTRANSTYKTSATNYFDGLHGGAVVTDVYDYSKIEVSRSETHREHVVFIFIGCIVYRDAVNDHNYAVIWHEGGAYRDETRTALELSDNISINEPIVYTASNSYIDTHGHGLCRYFSRRIVHYYSFTENTILPGLYAPNSEVTGFYDPIYWAKYIYDTYGSYTLATIPLGTVLYELSPTFKTAIVLRDYPQWKPVSYGTTDVEHLRELDYSDWLANKSSQYRDAFIMRNEGGEAQYCETDSPPDLDYLYNINDKVVLELLNPVTKASVITECDSDFEDGIFDFQSVSGGETWFRSVKFKIQYAGSYPLTYSTLGLTDATKYHKIGNLSLLKNDIPTDVTYSDYYTGNDYEYDVPETGTKYVKSVDLLKMLLATMNLYIYYTGCTFTFIPTDSTEANIVIEDEDVIDWELNTEEKEYIDCSAPLSILKNYTVQLINPFYNSIAGLDNVTAKCKVSRIGDTDYDDPAEWNQNDTLEIYGYEWKIEKLKQYEAYYDVTLTKYLAIP